MKLRISILILLFTKTTFGQIDKNLFAKTNVYGNLVTLTRIDSISESMMLGNFHISGGYCGFTYSFDTNFQFIQNHHCCKFDSTVDKGKWLIENKNSVILKSYDKSIQFCIIKLDNYYFLVPQQEQQTFVYDLNKMVDSANKKRFLKKKESENYRRFITLTMLSQKYYSSKII